ncbi:MAG: ClpXP protease specificity-enhancing factor SspB [Acidobacteriota bacterium]
MTDATDDHDPLDYPSMVQDALRGVARQCLSQVADEGLPGSHHFYLTFATGARGVAIAQSLKARYAEEMTIVIQHDYRDLEVDAVGFGVTLRFGGVPQRLYVPFSALVTFYDPSVPFALRFEPDLAGGALDFDAFEEDDVPDGDGPAADAVGADDQADGDDDNKVISIEAFRRK